MGQHIISGYELDSTATYAHALQADGVRWTRRRVHMQALAGETFVTVGPTARAVRVIAPTATLPMILATSDVAVPSKDTLTGVPQGVVPWPTANAVTGGA